MGYSKIGFSILSMITIHSKKYRDIISRLSQARRNVGFTQKEVAKILKKPQSYISKIETFQRRVDILELQNLAKIYKIDISKII